MPNEVTIPILPCASIQDMLAFYGALGFEVTYQQARPNTYACVKRDAIELHFFSMKGVEPANSYSTCLVLISDTDDLYQAFAAGLRQQYGKLPIAGIPRITRPHNRTAGDRRFNVIDPGGNWIRFVQQTPPAAPTAPADPPTRLSRAVLAAGLLMNNKGDFEGAAKMLDTALERGGEDENAVHRAQALILRAEAAANLDEQPLAMRLLSELRQLALTADQQAALTDELQKADELTQLLEPPHDSLA